VYTPRPLPPSDVMPARTRNVVVPGRGLYAWWEQWHLPRVHGPDAVLVCPSYVAPLRARCPILLIHHGSYEGYPGAFGWWTAKKALWAYKLSARRADRVVTVSDHSKRDIVRFYGIPESKISVIPEGVDTTLFRPIDDEVALSAFRTQVFGEDVPFILYVGKPVRRRNVPALFRAYARLLHEGRTSCRFLFIGSDLPGISVAEIVRELGLERHVTLIGHASHETVALAYNASSVLVYPSSYEGFGMPVLEAMACGTPAIALRNTAFLEFADGAAYLAERGDADTLFDALDRVLHDASLRQHLRRAGPERARAYDWRLIAERVMALVLELKGRLAACDALV
jgi:glycosyltransferase involved in cell wall biosynthesis